MREEVKARDFYRSQGYAAYLTQFSLIEQFRWVFNTQPSSILYVGVGSGFVPAYLRAQGFAVTTADINVALKPDIVCDVTRLRDDVQGRVFDVVMACEVLEHLPYHEFSRAVEEIRSVTTGRAMITLPVFRTFLFRCAVVLKVRSREFPLGAWLSVKKNKLPAEHCWEIGSAENTSLVSIRETLLRSFASCRDYRLRLNPYHHVFELGVTPR